MSLSLVSKNNTDYFLLYSFYFSLSLSYFFGDVKLRAHIIILKALNLSLKYRFPL